MNGDTKFGSLSWVELVPDSTEAPTSRSGHSLIYHEECLYLFGGKDDYLASNELWQYHLTAAVWTKLMYTGKRPPRLFNHSSILYDRKLFVFGGSVGSSFSMWVFDFDVFEWQQYSTEGVCPTNRHSQSVSLHNNRVWLYGGYTSIGVESDELWVYDLDESYWELIPSSPKKWPPSLFGHTAAFYGPIMWIFGGTHQRELQNALWCYDTELKSWRHIIKQCSPPPTYCHISIVTGDVMITYGGYDEYLAHSSAMWRFNFETEEWTQMISNELPALAGHAVAVSFIKSSSAEGSLRSLKNSKVMNDSLKPVVSNRNANGRRKQQETSLNDVIKNDKVVIIEPQKAESGYTPQSMFQVTTPGDIELRAITSHSQELELRPLTTQSTASSTESRASRDSHVSLPGQVEVESPTMECYHGNPIMQCYHGDPIMQSPQKLYHAVYENRVVSEQLDTRPGFFVNNPLYNDNILEEHEEEGKMKPSAITFYDVDVIKDNDSGKVDHYSDSGSQGSRSSLRKKRHYKRGYNTEFYIVGHDSQPHLPGTAVLYRCKIR